MKNREIAEAYLNAFSTGEPDSVASFVTDDFRNIQVGLLGTGCTGRDNYRERLSGFLAAFRNLRYDVQDLIAEGDKVAASYTMMFNDGGRKFEIEGVMIMTIRDDRIAVRKDYWDGLSHLKQTGLGL
jgi:ketosteroid isomerase-like protein